MAKTQKKKISKIKAKKKIWYKIIAPKLFGNREIGETYLSSAEKAVGRKMKVALRDLTGNMRDQHAYIAFQIGKVDGAVLRTIPMGYELTSAFVKRIVRKNVNKLDDYFVLHTKDGKKMVLKILMLTLHKTQRAVRTQLRKEAYRLLKEDAAKQVFSAFLENIVTNRLQNSLKKRLKKIHPLKEAAVRVLQLQPEKSVAKEEAEVVDESKKVKEKEEDRVEEKVVVENKPEEKKSSDQPEEAPAEEDSTKK